MRKRSHLRSGSFNVNQPKDYFSTAFNFDVTATEQTYKSKMDILKLSKSEVVQLVHQECLCKVHYFPVAGTTIKSSSLSSYLRMIQKTLHIANMKCSTTFFSHKIKHKCLFRDQELKYSSSFNLTLGPTTCRDEFNKL